MHIRKIIVLLEMGKPIVIAVMALMAFAGALFSPNFYSHAFTHSQPSNSLFSSCSGFLSPRHCSIAHAFCASLIAVLIWTGTALFNDYYDVQIDKRINPHRPSIMGEITRREVAYWAALAYVIAIVIVWTGSTASLFTRLFPFLHRSADINDWAGKLIFYACS